MFMVNKDYHKVVSVLVRTASGTLPSQRSLSQWPW